MEPYWEEVAKRLAREQEDLSKNPMAQKCWCCKRWFIPQGRELTCEICRETTSPTGVPRGSGYGRPPRLKKSQDEIDSEE